VIAALLATISLAVCYPPPVVAQVAVPFVQPACSYCPGHRGLEYLLQSGSPVESIASGVVIFSGMVAGTRYVVVRQTDGLRATYGMLQTSVLTRGDVVVVGGLVGDSGPRLYFGLRDAADQPVDPTPLLGTLVGRARLLPVNGGARRPPPAAHLTCSAIVSEAFPV